MTNTDDPNAYSLSFEWKYLFGCTWLVIGAFVDGWAHNNVIEDINSFFTIWHALLYSGYACASIILFKRVHELQAIPKGHYLSVVGSTMFLIGGFGDMLWHIFFGIEASTDSLLSPAHLVIAFGGFLILTGGIRAWCACNVEKASIPAIASLVLGTSIILYMTQFGYYTDFL